MGLEIVGIPHDFHNKLNSKYENSSYTYICEICQLCIPS